MKLIDISQDATEYRHVLQCMRFGKTALQAILFPLLLISGICFLLAPVALVGIPFAPNGTLLIAAAGALLMLVLGTCGAASLCLGIWLFRRIGTGSKKAHAVPLITMAIVVAGVLYYFGGFIYFFLQTVPHVGAFFGSDLPWILTVESKRVAGLNEVTARNALMSSLFIMSCVFVANCVLMIGILVFVGRGLVARYRQTPLRDRLYASMASSKSWRMSRHEFWVTLCRLYGIYGAAGYGQAQSAFTLLLMWLAVTFEASCYYSPLQSLGQITQAMASEEYASTVGEAVGTALFDVAIISIVIPLGGLAKKLRGKAERRIISSMELVRSHDQRSPVLFLRSFKDDQIVLHTSTVPLMLRLTGRVTGSLEYLLMQILDHLGPLVAIGNPSDHVSPFGAARRYVADSEWKEYAVSLMRESALIVVGVDETQGLAWEMAEIKELSLLHKTIFLIPPGQTDNSKLIAKVCDLYGEAGRSERGRIASEDAMWQGVDTEVPDQKKHRSSTVHYLAAVFPGQGKAVGVTANQVSEVEYEVALRHLLGLLPGVSGLPASG